VPGEIKYEPEMRGLRIFPGWTMADFTDVITRKVSAGQIFTLLYKTRSGGWTEPGKPGAQLLIQILGNLLPPYHLDKHDLYFLPVVCLVDLVVKISGLHT